VIALACPVPPSVANATALNLNTLLTRLATVGAEASEDDFTCPFANSDTTTNDCVVRFQITLKILFMEYKILLYKFNRINNTLDKTHTKRNLTGHFARGAL